MGRYVVKRGVADSAQGHWFDQPVELDDLTTAVQRAFEATRLDFSVHAEGWGYDDVGFEWAVFEKLVGGERMVWSGWTCVEVMRRRGDGVARVVDGWVPQFADQYCQVGLSLVVKAYLPDGGATTMALNPETGEFDVEPRFMLDFFVSWKNDPDYLDRDEFLRRAALQVTAKQYVDVAAGGSSLPAAGHPRPEQEKHVAVIQKIVENIERARGRVIAKGMAERAQERVLSEAARAERWITYEDGAGRHRHRLELGEWVIGRDPECDIVVKDFGLSRRHARLTVEEGGVQIADLKSKSGTQVNAVVIDTARLTDGDHILLGHFPVQFFDRSARGIDRRDERSTAPKGAPEIARPAPPRGDEVVRRDAEVSAAPVAWQREAPEQGALIRRIAAIIGCQPAGLDEHSALRELGDSYSAVMYVVTTIQNDCAVAVPMEELNRLHTVGELVDLIRKAPKIKEA